MWIEEHIHVMMDKTQLKKFWVNPYISEEDNKSFAKVCEIDDKSLTAKIVLSVNNAVRIKTLINSYITGLFCFSLTNIHT